MNPHPLGKWRTLSSKYVFKDQWLTIRCDAVELPNGKRIPDFYVLEYPDFVSVIAIDRKGKFLLVRQYRHGRGKVENELCAGIMEKSDTSPEIAARRELLEETGYGSGVWQKFMVTATNPADHNNVVYIFLAEGVEPIAKPNPDETEDLVVELKSAEEILTLLKNDEISESIMSTALWKYFALHQPQKLAQLLKTP